MAEKGRLEKYLHITNHIVLPNYHSLDIYIAQKQATGPRLLGLHLIARAWYGR